jgi:hypothetical protein
MIVEQITGDAESQGMRLPQSPRDKLIVVK